MLLSIVKCYDVMRCRVDMRGIRRRVRNKERVRRRGCVSVRMRDEKYEMGNMSNRDQRFN